MPVIDLKNCNGCLKCVKDCPAGAINIESGVIAETCIHCGHCVAICPESTVYPDDGVISPLQFSALSPEEFRNLTARIRSCRNYQRKDIDEDLLIQLLENIKHYPSASNARPLQITVVRSKEKVKLLNDMTAVALIRMFSLLCSPVVRLLMRIFMPSIESGKLQRYKNSFIELQKTNDSMICHHAPVVLLFHGKVSKIGMAEADANIWATYTSIYANTMGLATCFNGFIVKAMGKNSKLNKNFSIPASHQVYSSLLVGYPKVKYINESSRKRPEVNYI